MCTSTSRSVSLVPQLFIGLFAEFNQSSSCIENYEEILAGYGVGWCINFQIFTIQSRGCFRCGADDS